MEGEAFTIYILASVVAMGLLQHIVHECAHILMARIQGVEVLQVRWFTYSGGGTRVFYREEPSMNQEQIDTKWGWIALGGLMGTTLIGYLLTLTYRWGLWHRSAWLVSLLFFGSVIFLITDPLYFLIGALFGFGDVLGVMKVFHLRRPIAALMSGLLLALASYTIVQVWYR